MLIRRAAYDQFGHAGGDASAAGGGGHRDLVNASVIFSAIFLVAVADVQMCIEV